MNVADLRQLGSCHGEKLESRDCIVSEVHCTFHFVVKIAFIDVGGLSVGCCSDRMSMKIQ